MFAGLNTYDTVDWGNPISSDPLNRGLAAWFLAAPGRFRVGSLQWQDLTRVHIGTLTNSPTWDKDRRPGGAMCFRSDASTSHASVPHTTRLNLSETASTIAFWLKAPHAQTRDSSAFLDKGLGGPATGHAWAIRPAASEDDGRIRILIEDASADFSAGSYLNNIWCYIVVTWDGTNIRLYRNGALLQTVAQPAGTYRSPTAPLIIGALDASSPFIGAQCRLDDIRLYDARVLSAGQIAELYRRSVQCNAGLLNRWSLSRYAPEQAGAATAAFYYNRYVVARGKA